MTKPPGRRPDALVRSYTIIITTTATDEVGRIHDRMPMAIAKANWGDWLDRRTQHPPAPATPCFQEG